jgi:hypothetical protein
MKIHALLFTFIASMSITISTINAASKNEKAPMRIKLDTQLREINQKVLTLLDQKTSPDFTTRFLNLVKESSSKAVIEAYETTLMKFLTAYDKKDAKDTAEAIQSIKKINELTRASLSLPEEPGNKTQKKIATIFDTAREISKIIKSLSKTINSAYSPVSLTHYQKRYALELAATYAIGIYELLKTVVDILEKGKLFSDDIAEPVNKAAQDIEKVAETERKDLKTQPLAPIERSTQIDSAQKDLRIALENSMQQINKEFKAALNTLVSRKPTKNTIKSNLNNISTKLFSLANETLTKLYNNQPASSVFSFSSAKEELNNINKIFNQFINPENSSDKDISAVYLVNILESLSLTITKLDQYFARYAVELLFNYGINCLNAMANTNSISTDSMRAYFSMVANNQFAVQKVADEERKNLNLTQYSSEIF